MRPLDILANVGHTYVVVRLAQFKKPSRGFLHALIAGQRVKFGDYLRGGGGDNSQHLCFKKQCFFRLYPARIYRVPNDRVDYLRLKIAVFFGDGCGIGQVEEIQQDIRHIDPVRVVH